ncbi:MAG: 1-acyl-sn-glycerol-3-phosphate acyltransferase [Nitrospirota bacterium]|nr:1-acyl-sn-glycerol-3-phosphate acyltransferase [Nitrospirota bacterium]
MDINLRKVIEQKSPGFFNVLPGPLSTAVLLFLERVNRLGEVKAFMDRNAGRRNWEFIDAVFEYLDFRCLVSDEDIARIPAKGKLICVANHRLGALDGLSLLKIIGTVRKDVKIVVNDILMPLENMRDMFLFYDLYSTTLQKTNIQKIHSALSEENAVIFFPAGTVAKLTSRGVRELPWRNGPALFARKYGAPVLPMYVDAHSSLLYYLVSLINPELSSLFLSQAIFCKRSKSISVKIGEVIHKEELESMGRDAAAQTEFLREHVFRLGKGKG